MIDDSPRNHTLPANQLSLNMPVVPNRIKLGIKMEIKKGVKKEVKKGMSIYPRARFI